MSRFPDQIPDGAPLGASVLIATLGISLLALALPLVLLQVFDRVIPNQAYTTLDVLFLGLLAVLVIDFVFKVCRVVILGSEGEKYERRLTRDVIGRILGADSAAFEQGRAGSHVDRQDAIATLRDFRSGQARLLHIDLPFTFVFVGMIYLIGGWLVLVPLGCMVTLVLFQAVLKRVQAPVLTERRVVNERRYSFLIEFLSQIVTVKSLGMEEQMKRRYELLQDQSVEANRRLTIVTQFSQSFGAVLSQAAVAAMALFGAYLAIAGRIGVAELAACMLLNGRSIQPMLKLLGVWVQVEAAGESRRQLGDLFALPQRPPVVPKVPLTGEIALAALSVRSHGSRPIHALDLYVPAGGCVGITGSDGSGKGVLLQVIMGERPPTSGSALLDGRPAAEWAEARGHRGLVHVDSEPVVFEGTILQNLSLFGGAEATDRAIAVSRAIGLEEDIHTLPLGYDTPIRTRDGMTRGWLQRIGLARALALEPRILLLNEPNTALDHRGDAAILAALKNLRGRTTLLIASPRPSWLALADQVVDLSADDAEVAAWDADLAGERALARRPEAPRRIA
ncbi:MAG: ABC transporter transmembrane domain-containing protein [Jannaschia sp.]